MECPNCGGEMWDNRAKKRAGEFKPSAPDFKCKDKNCDGVVWPEKKKGGKARPEPQEYMEGEYPGDDHRDPTPPPQAPPPRQNTEEARKLFLERHKRCFQYVMETYVPLAMKQPELMIDLNGVAALTEQIMRGQENAR
jgi:hypothetical protein